MADNTQLNTGTGGDLIASDDIGPGVKYQRVKLTLGADGVNDGDVASGNPMPVNVSSALPAGTNNIGDVDVLSLPALPAGTNNIGDVDVLTVPAPLSTTGGGTEATALRVTIANDSTGVVSIDDNGGSLTVDGTVTANLAAGTNNIGDVDVLTVPAPLSTTGGGTEATALRVTIATDSTGVLSVDDNGGSLTVDGTVTANAGTGTFASGGDVAHDGADSGNPQKIGAKALAHGANPTAVAAADRTDLYANRHGILWTIGGHPNIITRSVRIADADGAQTDASIVGTINAGTKVAVTMVTVTCDAANTNATAVKLGFGATTIPADSATGANGVLLDHEGIAAGSGVNIGNGAAVIGIGADGEELRLTCEDPVGGFVIVTFSYFTIES